MKVRKVEEQVIKPVGKVFSTQIPTPLIPVVSIVMSMKTTTRPIQKGIVIRSTVGGGSSSTKKPKPSEANKGKGKGVVTEKTKEEK